jgi:hypothetical protein
MASMTVGDIKKFLANVPDEVPFSLMLTDESAEQIVEDDEAVILHPVGMMVEDQPPGVPGGKMVIMTCDIDFDDAAEYDDDADVDEDYD